MQFFDLSPPLKQKIKQLLFLFIYLIQDLIRSAFFTSEIILYPRSMAAFLPFDLNVLPIS